MKRALVTGGGGFIGYHMAAYLAEKGFDVTVIDNLSRGKKDDMFLNLINKKNVAFIQEDLTL